MALYVMANFENRNKENVPGLYFVDRQCIDCDLCRQTAPTIFKRATQSMDSYSFVAKQPVTSHEISLCDRAASECPVEAIGKKNCLQFSTAGGGELIAG
ncbi:MAG: putative ferredoxin [Verrucomicrobiales bacterium]|nr:putative ferredoxin [Verrucomicrobiales bacterium]